MSNRLVMDPNVGLRISREGVNVLTVSQYGKDVVFDSRWAGSSMIVARGIATIPNTTSAITINYGVTLPIIPTVLAMGRYRSSSISDHWVNLATYGRADDYITHGGNQSSTRAQAQGFMNLTYDPPPAIQIFNNRLVFQTKASYPDIDRISYIVLRF